MIIIERFEENIVLIEKDDEIMEIDRKLIPQNAKEGDLLIFINGVYIIDKQATEKRRREILERLKRLGL